MTAAFLLALNLVAAGPLTQSAPPPTGEGDAARRDDGPRRGRPPFGGGGGEADRAQWRERMERYRNATPEERRKLRIDGMVDMTARNYDLNDDEKATVRKEMESMQAERRAQMGPDADEYDKLREKMFEFWNQRRDTDAPSDSNGRPDWRRMNENPDFRALQDKMRAMDEKYPFDWQASIARVEKLLPEDKVKIGRERRAQWQGGPGNRGDDRRNRDDSERRRGRRNRDEGSRGMTPPAGDRMPPPPKPPEPAKVEPMRSIARTLHPWEEYVNQFSASHKLNTAQVASAHSVLKDCLSRAEKIEQEDAYKSAQAEAARPGASEADRKRLAELNAGKDKLFTELKSRLETLLTEEQRAK